MKKDRSKDPKIILLKTLGLFPLNANSTAHTNCGRLMNSKNPDSVSLNVWNDNKCHTGLFESRQDSLQS